MATKDLLLDKIRIDGGTQPRASLNLEAVDDYADAILAGAELPPAVVYFDGSENWLADGFHRFHANSKAERPKMLCEVRKGTLRDAILHAVGANGDHGLRRSNQDKRHAVLMLLADREWAKRSDAWIAEKCGVSQPFVSKVREPITVIGSTEKRTGRDGKQRPASAKAKTNGKAEHAARAVEFGMPPSAASKAFDVPQEEIGAAVEAPAEPNTIGQLIERYDAFVESLIAGQPPHVVLLLKEHSAEVWGQL